MIVFLAVRHHLYTVQSLIDGSYGPAVPTIRGVAYEDMLTADSAPAATYIFTDIERLSPWERLLAADLFRALRRVGMRCLNDPARVLTRYPLLRALHHAGINPFRAWRVEDTAPALSGSDDRSGPGRSIRESATRLWQRASAGRRIKPRFPVFLRNEADHGRPITGLLASQAELDAALAGLAGAGLPTLGLLGIEFCATPLAQGMWGKFGTFRVGDIVSADHAVVEDNWIVKHGSPELASDALFQWERDHVARNSFEAALRPVFEIAGIEFGRADHATVNGREIVYEINTNPHLAPLEAQMSPIRDDAMAIARARLAAAFWSLDSGDGSPLPLLLGERAIEHRDRSAMIGVPFRP